MKLKREQETHQSDRKSAGGRNKQTSQSRDSHGLQHKIFDSEVFNSSVQTKIIEWKTLIKENDSLQLKRNNFDQITSSSN